MTTVELQRIVHTALYYDASARLGVCANCNAKLVSETEQSPPAGLCDRCAKLIANDACDIANRLLEIAAKLGPKLDLVITACENGPADEVQIPFGIDLARRLKELLELTAP